MWRIEKLIKDVSPIFSNDKVNVESRFSRHLLGCHGRPDATSSKMAVRLRGHPPDRPDMSPSNVANRI